MSDKKQINKKSSKKNTQVQAIYAADLANHAAFPLYLASVSAGFPSPAEDYLEGQLDLNKYLISHPAATYFVRVTGDSMIEAGIHSGDLLLVDRSLEPQDKNVVIANVNGELTVKRIQIRGGKITLVPENKKFAPQPISPDSDLQIWGVVKHVIHTL